MLYHAVRLCAPHGASQKLKPLQAAPEREQSWGGVSLTTSNPWRVPSFPQRTSLYCEKRLRLMSKRNSSVHIALTLLLQSKKKHPNKEAPLKFELFASSEVNKYGLSPVVTVFHLTWSSKSDPQMHESTQAVTKELASHYFKTLVLQYFQTICCKKSAAFLKVSNKRGSTL